MKNRFKFLSSLPALVVIAAMLLTTSCSAPQKDTPPAFDLTAAKQEIEAANRNFMEVLSKGDSVGLANCYTSDAKFMSPNAPAFVGRSNIQTAIAGFINAGITKAELKAVEVWGTADLLAEEGELTLATKDGVQVDKGKYIVLWKKEDGKWKLFRDCVNSDLPVPATASK